MKNQKFIIKSNERNLYFVAYHGFTPFYSTKDKALTFHDETAAGEYAIENLFMYESAFTIEGV